VSNTQQSSTPPTDSKNKPSGLANVVAETFEGDGFWTAVKEEVAPVLTFGADLDPMLGDPDKIGVGPQDLDLSFTWDGLDDWLCEETVVDAVRNIKHYKF
jgi:hypothetical protein